MQYTEYVPDLLWRPASEIFRITRVFLSSEVLWTQGARARDEDGRIVKPHSPRAVCWSINGALALASNPLGVTPPVLLRVLDYLARQHGLARRCSPQGMWEDVDDVNDNCTHATVLGLLDDASLFSASVESLANVKRDAYNLAVVLNKLNRSTV